MNDGVKVEVVRDPDDSVLAPLNAGLHGHNVAALGEDVIAEYHRLAVVAHDDDGKVVGGAWGEVYWDWLHIDTLWVDPEHRGQGLGERCLCQLEREAVAMGFPRAHLETTSFQARGFYEKLGYTVFGELEGKPSGATWFYMRRDLTQI